MGPGVLQAVPGSAGLCLVATLPPPHSVPRSSWWLRRLGVSWSQPFLRRAQGAGAHAEREEGVLGGRLDVAGWPGLFLRRDGWHAVQGHSRGPELGQREASSSRHPRSGAGLHSMATAFTLRRNKSSHQLDPLLGGALGAPGCPCRLACSLHAHEAPQAGPLCSGPMGWGQARPPTVSRARCPVPGGGGVPWEPGNHI